MSREVQVRFCESRAVRSRPATHLVVLTDGDRGDVADLREDIVRVLEPLGLRLSAVKTRIVHMSEGFDFLGFHIRWRRKRGTTQWYVYTFIADRPIKALKTKIRALTHGTSLADLGTTLIRLNQILRGWSAYFRHAVATHTFKHLQQITWWAGSRPGTAGGGPPCADI